MAKLVVTEQGEQRTVEIGSTDVVEVGRDEACGIRISDPLSSRRHCRVLGTMSGFELVDLGSSNGTVHNGHRVERVPLVAGDRIQIGEVRIEFIEEPRSEQATAPLVEPETPTVREPAPPPPSASKPKKAAPQAAPLPPEPESDDAPHLVVVNGPLQGRRLALRAPFLIGRKEDCDLVLPDRKASGAHARIEAHGARWLIRDLDSGNGLFLGKSRIRKHQLQDGDLLQVGDTQLRVRGIPSGAPSGSPSQVIRALDEGEITEEDLSRLTPRMLEEEGRLQWLHTLIVLVSGVLIVYFGRSTFIDLTENRLPLDEANLLGVPGSFENPPEGGWAELWEVDAATSDAVVLEGIEEPGLPHGDAALSVRSTGGSFRAVRLYDRQLHDFTEGEAFRLSGQLKAEGFTRVGLALRWYTRRGAGLGPVEESYTVLDDRKGAWIGLEAAMIPPSHGEPTACQVGILALGSGRLLADALSLVRIERPEAEGLRREAGTGLASLGIDLDPKGIITVSRGRESLIRSLRLARGAEAGGVPWGQLFPTSRSVLEVHETGSIRNDFDLDRDKVTQITEIDPAGVRVTWSAPFEDSMQLVLELGRSLEGRASSVFLGDSCVAARVDWSDLSTVVGEEWVIGRGAEQITLRLGVPGVLQVLDPVAARNGLAVSWTPREAPPAGVLELSLGTVSDREKRRLDEAWETFAARIAEGREGEALGLLDSLGVEFPWREDVVERVAQERARILESAAAGWSDLRAMVDDLRQFPGTPISRVLVERSEEFSRRFAGTDEARRARDLVTETSRAIDARRTDEVQERARGLLAEGNRYFEARRDRLARIYYRWVEQDHPGTEEARTAGERLRIIEARE